MPKRVIDVRDGNGFLDFVSYGRGGSERPISLSRAQIEQIARTVGRTPEVMVKVLPKDSNNAGSIQKHVDYIGRRGDLELETDDGSLLRGKDAGKELLSDWDLDLETHRRESEFAKTRGRAAPKLVHKLMFSPCLRQAGWEVLIMTTTSRASLIVRPRQSDIANVSAWWAADRPPGLTRWRRCKRSRADKPR